MSTVSVSPQILRWARERAELSVAALAEHFPKYELWESGEKAPTLRQLEQLAQRTYTPLGYFFLPSPPEEKLPVPDFRTVKDRGVRRPSPNLLDTIQTMQRRQDWLRDYLREREQPALAFVGSKTVHESVAAVATSIRATLQLSADWARSLPTWSDALRALRRAIEAAGVVVAVSGVVGTSTRRKLDPNEFRGFVLPDAWAPLIFVNGADAKAAQMFTLAHELAHLWLDQGGVFGLTDMQPADNEVERWCNHVAAELLVPEAEIRGIWNQAELSEDPFQFLARRYKVSPLVAARRALDLKLISKDQFFSFYNHSLEDERRQAEQRPSGGDFYLTQEVRIGRRFGETVVRAAREGHLLYQDAYRLTGLHGATFDRYAQGLEGIGA